MACALVMLFSMGQVNNTHSTTVRTVYAGVFPTRHTDSLLAFADVLRYPRTLISDRDRWSAHRWKQERKHGWCSGRHQGD
jgi:hypothetical protein